MLSIRESIGRWPQPDSLHLRQQHLNIDGIHLVARPRNGLTYDIMISSRSRMSLVALSTTRLVSLFQETLAFGSQE